MRVCNINIYVSDLEFAVEWYQEVLGLKAVSRKSNPAAVFLHHDNNLQLILHKAEKDTDLDIWKESGTVITFEVKNLREKIKELKECGVIMMSDESNGERIAFKDPFGNIHELAEMPTDKSK